MKEDTSRRWFSFRAKLIDICSSYHDINNDSGRVSPRDFLLRLLYLDSGHIDHPQLGKIRIKVRGGNTGHYNMSFSKSPSYCEGWSARELIEEYGYADTSGHRKALRIRVGIIDDNKSEKLGLLVKDGNVFVTSRNEKIALWKKDILIEKFHQLSKILLVNYSLNPENLDGKISFSNPKLAFLNMSLLENSFEEYIRSGKISPEFRMYIGEDHDHCRSRNIKPGAVRDHGFGWRLKAIHGDEVYSVTEIS